MLNILVVDPHPVICEGVKQILQAGMNVPIGAEQVDASNAVATAKQRNCDLILLEMPDDGLEILKVLRSEKPDVPVLVYSTRPDREYGVRALRMGASGYLSKDKPSGELISAVRKVCHGGKYVSPELSDALVAAANRPADQPAEELLSNRELQIMLMLAGGKTVTAIANELNLSIKTISTYRTRALEKLNLKNNVELTRYAIRHGLIGIA